MLYKINLHYELRKGGEIYFECPFCWSKYKKNNKPSKNAKNVFHKLESEQINIVDKRSVISRNVCDNIPDEYDGFYDEFYLINQ